MVSVRAKVPGLARFRVAQRLLVLLGIVLGLTLVLVRLDDIYLWQDEAETALVARHLLKFGLPLSNDGYDWVQQSSSPFTEFASNYVWIYHSWLQYAITAASFLVLGQQTTLAARLPFALIGMAVVVFYGLFLGRWLGRRRLVWVSVILLLLCVPFLLLMRQCRYYALAALFTLAVVDSFLRVRNGDCWAVPYFVLSAVLLYHAHYGAFFPVLLALGLDWLLIRPRCAFPRRFLSAILLIIMLVLPWAWYMRVLGRGDPFRLDRFLAHVVQHVVFITAWLVPTALCAVVLVAWWQRHRRPNWSLSDSEMRYSQLVLLIVGTNVLSLSASAAFDWVYFRYMVHLIPFLLSIVAIGIGLLLDRWPVVGYLTFAVCACCNLVALVPYGLPPVRNMAIAALWPSSPAFQSLQEVWRAAGQFRSEPLMYLQELSHSYEGPNEGLVAYLNAHAEPGQTAAVNYEDLPVMFYTDLRVLGGLGLHGLDVESRPDWVVDRRHGPYRDLLAQIVRSGTYELIELPYPDIRWENRPEPGVHNYLTVEDAPPVILYRRMD